MWDRVIAAGFGFVSVAYVDGRAVAGAVFLAWKGTIIYKYGASDHHAWKLRPNNLLFAEAIRWSAENGYATFDFGRSGTADEGLTIA